MPDNVKPLNRKPWLAGGGFFILVGSVIGGILAVKQATSSDPHFGGLAGLGVVAVWLITVPLSFLLGLVSVAIKERPKALSIALLILSGVLIAYYVVVIVPLS